MKNISVDITKAAQFLKPGAVEAYESQVKAAQEALENGTCLHKYGQLPSSHQSQQ